MAEPDQRVAEIAATQFGLVRRAQVRVHLTERMIQRRLEAGSLYVVAPGVLAIAGAPSGWRRQVMAACLASGGSASHRTAARLRHFPRVPSGPVEVTVAAANYRLKGARLHQSNAMAPHWTTRIGPIPTMTAERTVIDLAAVLEPKRLEIVLDAALDERIVEIGPVIDAFDALAVRGRRGVAALRPLLEARGIGVFVDTSELERMFTHVLRGAGIEEPRRQVLLGGEQLIGLVDFLFERARLIVEVDGRKGHSQLLDIERDHRRDQIAQMENLRIVRFTYRQIRRRPEEVAEVMHRLLSL